MPKQVDPSPHALRTAANVFRPFRLSSTSRQKLVELAHGVGDLIESIAADLLAPEDRRGGFRSGPASRRERHNAPRAPSAPVSDTDKQAAERLLLRSGKFMKGR